MRTDKPAAAPDESFTGLSLYEAYVANDNWIASAFVVALIFTFALPLVIGGLIFLDPR